MKKKREQKQKKQEGEGEGEGDGEGFELNVVLPSACFGPSFGEQQSPTLKNIRALIRADMEGAEKGLSPCEPFVHILIGVSIDFVWVDWFVDVRDTARLHVAGLINPSVKSERLFAYSETYSWSQILDIYRRAYPNHPWVDCPVETRRDLTTLPECQARAVELLKELGREGFIGLEESVKANAEECIPKLKVKGSGL